jgi:hypothetical protein
MTGPGEFVKRADDGREVVFHDVVDGRYPELVDDLVALHAASFPEHPFAAELARVDAERPSVRDGIVVHQWIAHVDGVPAGFSFADSNLVRNVVPIHFMAVDPALRSVRIDGCRLGEWLLRDTIRQMVDDGRPGTLGAFAETPDYKVEYFLRTGWRIVPVDYAEPVHGWDWPTLGLEMRPLVLLWLPNPALDAETVDALEPTVAAPGAASFLLDMYRLPVDEPLVAALVGDEAAVDRPHRDT